MNNKGFTLIELLVVVLIIGILAAMALPQYFKAVERSRMAEATTLMANIAQSQQRKYLQIQKYVNQFNGLDVAPKNASGTTHCTKGGAAGVVSSYLSSSCGTGNAFVLKLEGTTLNGDDAGRVYALRAGGGNGTQQYTYEMSRAYSNTGTACRGVGASGQAAENGASLCADFCGVDRVANNTWCCTDGNTDGGTGAKPSFGSGTCAPTTDA